MQTHAPFIFNGDTFVFTYLKKGFLFNEEIEISVTSEFISTRLEYIKKLWHLIEDKQGFRVKYNCGHELVNSELWGNILRNGKNEKFEWCMVSMEISLIFEKTFTQPALDSRGYLNINNLIGDEYLQTGAFANYLDPFYKYERGNSYYLLRGSNIKFNIVRVNFGLQIHILKWSGDHKSLLEDLKNNQYLWSFIHYYFTSSLVNIKRFTSNVFEVLGKQLESANYKEANKIARKRNESLLKKQILDWNENTIISVIPSHRFVDSHTVSNDNVSFGRLGERAVYKFLKIHYVTNWVNESSEQFSPYDLTIQCDSEAEVNYIEVKTSRFFSESTIFFSINELKFMLQNADRYFLARVFMLQEGEEYRAYQLNDEFGVNIYRPKRETLDLICRKIDDWENHYNSNAIRFSVEHFSMYD